MEAHKVVFSILKEIEKGKDIRSTPSSGRKGAFKRGWLDAVSKEKEYKDATLDRLTWQNLGYRIGSLTGESSVELIDNFYTFLEGHYHSSKRTLEDKIESRDPMS